MKPTDTISWQKASKKIGRSGYWKRSVSIKNVSTVNADNMKQVPDLQKHLNLLYFCLYTVKGKQICHLWVRNFCSWRWQRKAIAKGRSCLLDLLWQFKSCVVKEKREYQLTTRRNFFEGASSQNLPETPFKSLPGFKSFSLQIEKAMAS